MSLGMIGGSSAIYTNSHFVVFVYESTNCSFCSLLASSVSEIYFDRGCIAQLCTICQEGNPLRSIKGGCDIKPKHWAQRKRRSGVEREPKLGSISRDP